MLLEGNLQSVQHLGLPVVDIEKAKAWYVDKLGFKFEHEVAIPTEEGDIKIAFLLKDDLTLEFYQLVGADLEAARNLGRGHVDHFAIDTLDIKQALQEALAAGLVVDETTTPEGLTDNPALWPKGTTYVFFDGPHGEKIEFNQVYHLDPSRRPDNLGGWAHLGIPVTNIDRSKDFYRQFGFDEVAYVEIPVEDEAIKISIMDKDGFKLEFYQLVGDDLAAVKTRVDGRIDHFALDVLDADKAFEELRATGFETLEEAPVPLPCWEKGVKYFNIRGPEGEKIEFNQIIK